MRPTKTDLRILTNDPSFTAWGWAVVDEQSQVLARGCIKTAPEHKKTRIRAGDDRVRRTIEIVQQLQEIISGFKVNYMLSELPHGSQNASAAIMMGVVVGITSAMSECLGIPIEYYSEQDAKKALLRKKSATKEETIEAISKAYNIIATGPKYFDEAVADALAIHYVASKQSTTLKMMK